MTTLICSCGWTAQRGPTRDIKTARCPDCAQRDERERCASLCEGLEPLRFGEPGEAEAAAHRRCAELIRGDLDAAPAPAPDVRNGAWHAIRSPNELLPPISPRK
jgi:hypothetical protein